MMTSLVSKLKIPCMQSWHDCRFIVGNNNHNFHPQSHLPNPFEKTGYTPSDPNRQLRWYRLVWYVGAESEVCTERRRCSDAGR
jgi:hypothetical protein